MSTNSTYIVSYDITSNKLRRKIEKTLKNYGIRLQYSVFICRSKPNMMDKLVAEIDDLLRQMEKLKSPGDSIAVIGALDENNVEFLLGNACIFDDFMIL